MNEFVTITRREYEKLLLDRAFLQALTDEGIEDWKGYDKACEKVESETGRAV